MTEYQYLEGGNTEAKDRLATSFLFAQTSVGLATTGVLAGLAVAQTGTASAAVLVSAGAGVSQDTVGNGVAMMVNDTQKTLDILTGNPMGGTPRNDIVVFDSATASIRAIIGTPNASPTDPTVPTTAIPLARVRNLASATTIPTAQIDELRFFTSLAGVNPKPVKYTSVGGTPPTSTVSNLAGTILQTLVVPGVAYARTLDVSMSGYVDGTIATDVWEVVGTVDSANITINVAGRGRISDAGGGTSSSFRCLVDQPANTAKTLRVWVRQVSGTGVGSASSDDTYVRIEAIAHPA